MPPKLQFVPRKSTERGQADHGWLKTFHTFSFASYQSSEHNQYGSLRVINEDRVSPRTGFGTHPHREFEIFSYIVRGALEHKDSLSNVEILKRGHVQMTSTGTGISHSEKTHGTRPVHFLQIWATPKQRGLQPKYYTRYFGDEEKRRGFVKVVAPAWSENADLRRDGNEVESKGNLSDAGSEVCDTPAPVQSDLTMYATIISPGSPEREVKLVGSKGYVHLIQTSGYNAGEAAGGEIRIVGVGQPGEHLAMREGDGAYLKVTSGDGAVLKVENVGDTEVELLVFDLD
ncbi:RmlC-like cupin domain-containing protein [Ephemerocybe angulata]|uniref:RmlC-like cupin domain-containing protein n=1 Tax=Ephemerocybe angulata TaxID=980116 RepID=A0A8H6I7W3_9AGAR|nr:RmlC-like cupin domain-containing protein [Tulosesus angulatus]